MLFKSLLAVILLPLLVSAHFQVLYPPPRSNEVESEAAFPCGGIPVLGNRTLVSTSTITVALEMGHDRSIVQMLLALGNAPGDTFNITLGTFQQQGEGSFCLPSMHIPPETGVADGMNGTLQVVTNGEAGGGLYMCADVTFTTDPMILSLPGACINGTGITAVALSPDVNANETNADGSPQASSSSSSSATASASSPANGASTSPTNNAAILTATWGVLGAVVLGAVALM